MVKPNSKSEEQRQRPSYSGIITSIVIIYTKRKAISLSCLYAFSLAWGFIYIFYND